MNRSTFLQSLLALVAAPFVRKPAKAETSKPRIPNSWTVRIYDSNGVEIESYQMIAKQEYGTVTVAKVDCVFAYSRGAGYSWHTREIKLT